MQWEHITPLSYRLTNVIVISHLVDPLGGTRYDSIQLISALKRYITSNTGFQLVMNGSQEAYCTMCVANASHAHTSNLKALLED